MIPELAAREHLTAIETVVSDAIREAGVKISDLSAVAVTHAPGLVPALLTGITFAKGFSASNGLPLIGINHFLGHIYGSFVDSPEHKFNDRSLYPMLAMVVSGGHTSLLVIKDDAHSVLAGTTLDDAAGEAFDKAAKMLNLGYPGGPVIERLSVNGDAKKYHFPRSLTGAAGKALSAENRFNFSFSGLKTALLYHTKERGGADALDGQELFDTLASYQEAIVDVLCTKAFDAARYYNVRSIVLCGGVACNGALRRRFEETVPSNIVSFMAPKKYCTDNAAMIAGLGYHYFVKGVRSGLDLDAVARLPLEAVLPFDFIK